MGTVAAGGSRTEREGMIACLVNDARALSLRAATREILAGFKKNDLLTYASAISFGVFSAPVPRALPALGLMGPGGRANGGSPAAAPPVGDTVPPPVYHLIDDTVRKVLAHRQLFWV